VDREQWQGYGDQHTNRLKFGNCSQATGDRWLAIAYQEFGCAFTGYFVNQEE
jgi:hypothetical protein